MQTIKDTDFKLPGLKKKWKGKVRDMYNIDDKYLVMVATDRISAFDHVLPEPIPYKGEVLNQLAAHFMNATKDAVPNWILDIPDPRVTIGRLCNPYPIEMVIRGYLAGHAWREYKKGERSIAGVSLPEGLKENDKLPWPIITPSTKSATGHDEDISRDEIMERDLISETDFIILEDYTRTLFDEGTRMAEKQGLILVDTKYEFGYIGDEIYVIDEIHTPDSSRFFIKEGYDERQQKGRRQEQLSKEFVREWLMGKGFRGLQGQSIPDIPESFIQQVSQRYIQLYETLTGKKFQKSDHDKEKIEENVIAALEGIVGS